MTKLRYILSELRGRGYLTTKEQFTIEDAVQFTADSLNDKTAKSLVDEVLKDKDFEKLKEFRKKLGTHLA